jgi:predicted nucleic acid-binding Zn ribbon protein
VKYNRKEKEMESLGSILGPLLRSLGLEERVKIGRLFSCWPDIVGDTIANHAKPVEYSRGILIVCVDSSTWLAELSQYMKPEIVKKVRSRSGSLVIRDIKFRLG